MPDFLTQNDWKVPGPTNVNVLLLVAHPDDETIFCGGTMLTYPNWNWTVACLTHSLESQSPYSQVRSQQFHQAMETFKQQGVHITYRDLGQDDKDKDITENDLSRWREPIKALNLSPDIVLSHNTRGEYGHEQHIAVNKIVNELFSNVWEFICPSARNVSPQPFRSVINTVPLSGEILEKKTAIFNHCYPSELNIWREMNDLMLYEFKTGPEIFTSDGK